MKQTQDYNHLQETEQIVVEKIKTTKKLPYDGMFSPIEIPEKEIDEITSQWSKTVTERFCFR